MSNLPIHWGDKVHYISESISPLVMGIDPDINDIPDIFKNNADSAALWLLEYVDFLLTIANGHVGFIKFQSAFFEACGTEGIQVLAVCIKKARKYGYGIILDAKRGDISSTSKAYAQAYLTPCHAGGLSDLEVDCITINPFLGPESLEPFINCSRNYGKGLFILAKTSNPGSAWLQDKKIDGYRVSDRTAEVINIWAQETINETGLSAIGAVVGITHPKDGKRLRNIMPNSVILAPGLGAQGGNTREIGAMQREDGTGLIISASRGITKVEEHPKSKEHYEKLVLNHLISYKSLLQQ